MQIFPGYDAHSATLRPSPLRGDCMRGIIDDKYVTAYTDSFPPIFSGDFARLWIAYPDEWQAIIKLLRVSRSGRWFGECADGVFEIGTLVRPLAIEKVVALSDEPLIAAQPTTYRKATKEDAEHFAELARDVVEEWRTQGHVDGVPFPGLNRVCYFMEDRCTRNPEYRSPVPL